MIAPGPSEGLIPPRPNLGPEPWADPPGGPRRLPPWAWFLAPALLLAAWRWRRLRRRRIRPAGDGLAAPPADPDPSPRLRMIAASDSVRVALIGAFGPSWKSKTTEEIAAEPAVGDRLGPDRAARLGEFLAEADRAKFAGQEPGGVEGWEAWAASFAEGLAAGAAGARSRINGK